MALDPDSQRSAKRVLLRHVKAARTMLIVICSFSISWLPYIISLCHHLITAHGDSDQNVNVRRILAIPLFLNSLLNPMVYAFRIPGFRNQFIRTLFCGKCGDCTNSVAPVGSSNHASST